MHIYEEEFAWSWWNQEQADLCEFKLSSKATQRNPIWKKQKGSKQTNKQKKNENAIIEIDSSIEVNKTTRFV